MHIHYITNSSLLIETNGVKLLVDGIFSNRNIFNKMNEELENQIFNSTGNFAGINCLLFTHCHEDHYDGSKVKKYLEIHQETKLIIPRDSLICKESQDTFRDFDQRVFIVNPDCKSQVFSINDVKIYYHKTKHLSHQMLECEDHYSIVIEDSINRILIAGDMELDDEEAGKLYQYSHFDILFFNPVVLCKKNWIDNFIAINATKKYIYHIPSKENDRFYYRKMAIYHHNMLKNRLQNCELLLDERQDLRLKKK